MWYVTMRNKFMSGWGLATGKSNYLLFRCNTEEEADIVADNGVARSDMHKVYIHSSLGKALSSLPKKNLTQWFEQGDGHGYDGFYQKDFFKNQKEKVCD